MRRSTYPTHVRYARSAMTREEARTYVRQWALAASGALIAAALTVPGRRPCLRGHEARRGGQLACEEARMSADP